MAQSVRRPETLGAMNLKPQGDKTRTSYFCNVKSRLGSKLPAGVSQPPQFAKPPWETQPQAQTMHEATASIQLQNQPIVRRPLDHIPHIRNPKLRQYYLQGTSWDLNNTLMTKEPEAAPSDDSANSRGLPGDTVFNVSFQLSRNGEGKSNPSSQTPTQPSSATCVHTEQLISKGKTTSAGEGSSQPELELGSEPKGKVEADVDQGSDILTAQPQSPSPEAEYDKLLDVEAVSLPDGQLYLLALPPECCQGEGPEATLYLKLFCRYITDGKGVVTGILLVTSNKIFFDPSKTHPLVEEHGCEEYLLSCSVDSLASVSFFSDVSHVHFIAPQQRRKGKRKNILQKLKNTKSRGGGLRKLKKGASCPALVSAAQSESPGLARSGSKEVSEEDEEVESRDMAEVEQELESSSLEVLSEESVGGLAVLSSAATFCCGAQETARRVTPELPDTEKSSGENQSAVPWRSSAGNLMFVRLRVQSPPGKRSSSKSFFRREFWLALSRESSDELHTYLKRHRPGLCVLEGEEEDDEEGFVLIEDKGEEVEEKEEEEEEEEGTFRIPGSGEDWEMVLMEESKDKPTLVIDKEPEGLSNVVESSSILEASHVRELCKELPPRTVGLTWRLTYSTSRHGSSLKSLYRKLSATDSPVLIVIKDALDEIFGAFLSHPLKPSEAFYGTGETFLFMLHPRFKCFRWTGENSFFIKGDLDCFAVGGGSGHFGLWVDENLFLGRSSPCYTFNNCCLSETDDFRIMELEVWTFSS